MQIERGDVVLGCVHLRQHCIVRLDETFHIIPGSKHFFQYEGTFTRPDGTKGESSFLICCDKCFMDHMTDPENVPIGFDFEAEEKIDLSDFVQREAIN